MSTDKPKYGTTRSQKLICGVAFMLAISSLLAANCPASEFQSDFAKDTERIWIGQDYFANRMLDWRLSDGRLECTEGWRAKPTRTVHLLTHSLSEQPGDLVMSVRSGPLEAEIGPHTNSWTGFLIGVGGEETDFRISALCHHFPGEDGGLIAAIDGTGRAVFRDNTITQKPDDLKGKPPEDAWPLIEPTFEQHESPATKEMDIHLKAEPYGESYRLTLTAFDCSTGRLIARAVADNIQREQLTGNIALVSHNCGEQGSKGYWFQDWNIAGSKLETHNERSFGPIFSVLHTLSGGTLKMTAQLGPLGLEDTKKARLEIQENGKWKTAAHGIYEHYSYTVPFRVENWDSTKDTPYRVVYDLRTAPGTTETYYYTGTIRKPPSDRNDLVVAAFTGQNISSKLEIRWNHNHFWYPHNELTSAVAKHKPDVLFFSGDQVYERGLSGTVREPADAACVDYLYHWIRWCWAFQDLTKDIPSVCLPDDHDVYHGNIWGAGGRQAPNDKKYRYQSDRGGYMLGSLFANAVHRTQVSHLPDPVDPIPIANGISVYFTNMEYAGISFGIIADRMWKSSPTVVLPKANVVNGWIQNKDFDPITEADVPGAELLGKRQLKFLNDWAVNWGKDTFMKVLLSQTIFVNVATLPNPAKSDAVVPGMPIPKPGEYVEGDRLAADCDSNGWPQTGRNKALQAIRKGFALHIAGDQHLGSFTQYGVDRWGDASYALCVPSVSNLWPRRWFPPEPGQNREPGSPRYAGDFRDGFGNLITVKAVANPAQWGIEPKDLYDSSPGYGIVHFHRDSREIEIECWPRWVDPAKSNAKQYAGWPFTIKQTDNYFQAADHQLPKLEVAGTDHPLVEVLDASSQEILYAIRIPSGSFTPKVYEKGEYVVRITDSRTGESKEFRAKTEDSTKTIEVRF